MKLISAQATTFRNIIDTGEFEIAPTTCLVGKNEAGKTAFLKALEGLRSTNSSYKSYDKEENYPRRLLAQYKELHGDDEATVIETNWEMSGDDVAAIEAELGKGVLTSTKVKISKTYESNGAQWIVPLDEKRVLSHLIKRFALTAEDEKIIADATSTQSVAAALEKAEEKNDKQQSLLEAIKKFRKSSATLKAIDILDGQTPKFLYFSHYDRMSGQISANKLAADKDQKKIDEGDQVFLDFLEYAGTTLDELVGAKKFEGLTAKCEAAAVRITDQIFEYWTQNDALAIQVVLSEGKPGDPAPYNSGAVARARVWNDLHKVSVPFSERSAGFIWFFSFLVKFAQIKEKFGNVIILLDEPGLTLHGTAQMDLLRYFKEKIEPNHQLIYTTHSPFMVPPDNLSSVRTVEDVVRIDERNRKRSEGTKIRGDILTTDPQTNFPLFGAMGFEVAQTLIIGKNTLLVEGPSDILYLQAVSEFLRAKGRTALNPQWAICPSGGIDKVLPFVRLFYGNSLNIAVLTDFERGQKRKLNDLYKAELLEKERIVLATEIAGKDEADIEDFFDPEVLAELITAAYDLQGDNVLTAEKLLAADDSTQRLVKKAEAYFRVLPNEIPVYSHFAPALHLLKHPEFLDRDLAPVKNTLEKFETAFRKIEPFFGK